MENPSEQGAFDFGAFGWRTRNPGRVLANALRRFEERVLALMADAGHAQTRHSHVNLTRHLDVQGTRITELARRASITNPAMSELIDQCAALGLVERAADPTDKRVRIIRFTPAGLVWLAAFGRAVAAAEAEMAQEIGARSMNGLFTDLARYASTMEPSITP